MEKQAKNTAPSAAWKDTGAVGGTQAAGGKPCSAASGAASKAASDAAELAKMAAQAEAAFSGTAENATQDSAAKNGTGRPSGGGTCGASQGSLPGNCAPLAFPYVPVQGNSPVRYSRMEALETGTLFPGLNLPFKAAIQANTGLNNTALVELMALDFALQELGLYLNTHPEDQEVLQLYWSYVQLAREGRERYQEAYGPLLQTDLTPEQGYAWLKDPWPWDLGGNR